MRQQTATLHNQRKTAWTRSWALTGRISPTSRRVSAHALHMYMGESRLLGRITNQSCTSTAPSRLAEIGALELHEIGRWCSVPRHCLLSTTGHGWYCLHDGKSFMKVRQSLLCSLLTHSFLFVFTPHAHYPFGVFLCSCGWLAHWRGITLTLFWRMRGTLS